ncbi:nitrite reductase/ring-hydroxylating ferredoxin subunit [Alteromonadaceae bacterium 2753L.S.0a.02]|nr:nitrite reductase/ring-hydroxylating ferredoxin subunit [Alteromonadaceae bacterium 2753L.S.0a.02]
MKVKLFDLSALPEGGAVSFEIHDKKGFAVKYEGDVFVYENSCPHLNIPLEWQENQFLDGEGHLIQCSTHGALFLINSGECISGPCMGDKLQPIAFEIDEDAVFAV